jgi:hypothetical protein
MDLHGWGEIADQLRGLSRRGAWEEMTELVSDEMLETFAIVSDQSDLADALLSRYSGLADRLTLYIPFIPGDRDEFWRNIATKIQNA